MKLGQEHRDVWVEAAIAHKKCADQDRDAAREALTQSLGTIYQAVAFDIDGTLTLPNSTELDPDVCRLIAKLLRRGCHVWLVTGRGTSGARKLAAEIGRHGRLDAEEALRLRCVSHNGGLVQQTDPSRPTEVFGDIQRLLDPFDEPPFIKIGNLRSTVNSALQKAGLQPDSLTQEPTSKPFAFGLRAIFNDVSTRDAAATALQGVLAASQSMQIRVGEYGQVFPLDLTNADKAAGLANLAARCGIDPEYVLRVGDQGHAGGSDESLLAGKSGFSAKEVSDSPTGCFPVVDQNGNVLIGATATGFLLETLTIAAPLRMSVPESDDYRKRLVERLRTFERLAVRRARNETRMIERQLSVRVAQLIAHDPGDGDFSVTVNEMFDRRSGGVMIHEWDLPELKSYAAVNQLFQFDVLDRATTQDNGPDRSLYTDSGILLRGPAYYWNLTGRRGPENVGEYMDVSLEFTIQALEALEELRAAKPSPSLVQIALAVMDNIRNIVLQLLNVTLFNAQPPASEDDAVSFADRHLVSTIGDIAQEHINAYVYLLLEPHASWAMTLESCEIPLQSLRSWIEANGSELIDRTTTRSAHSNWAAGKKADTFRWRETDDIVQNLSAVAMGLRAIADRPAVDAPGPILAVGLQYGGLELPLLAAALAKRFGLTIKPAAMRMSMYSDATQGEGAGAELDKWVAEVGEGEVPVIALYSHHPPSPCEPSCVSDDVHVRPEQQYPDVILFDDNCTTGRTIQASRDLLIRRGCDVRAVVIVRFPGANRAAHMMLANHGHLDISLAHNFVHGLVGPSPYSRLVVKSPHKKGYEDENGVFDKAKMRLRLLLHKNAPGRYPMPVVKPWGITQAEFDAARGNSATEAGDPDADSGGSQDPPGRA